VYCQAGVEKREQKLQLLRQYVSEHGVLPKAKTKYGGEDLGQFCRYQRKRYNSGQLSAAVQQALEDIPGWAWEVSVSISKQFMLNRRVKDVCML
jgi:hypothetical protein